jgi:ornithine cyclodeaminase/alanine dehydrogenase-like protein (mu-crystallin family)
MPLLLSEEDVRIVLSMDDLIAAMRPALEQFSARAVEQPVRSVLEVGLQKAAFGIMPAFIKEPPALGAKLVSVFASNAGAGLPTHLATILLFDPMTGELIAAMDGRFITEARTAAVSAVSTDLLAREDAAILAVIGSGVQARSHVDAITRVREIRAIRAWSPNDSHRAKFVREMQPRTDAKVTDCRSAQAAVDAADIVVLATSSKEPVVLGEWISAGTHICAVGACRPDQREMDTALVARGRLFVDSRSGALVEAGDVLLPMREGAFDDTHIAGELGEVSLGIVPGRQSPAEITIFKSLGMAVEDVAAAHLAYEKAAERGLGRGFVL